MRKWLRQLRKNNHLTQGEIADKIYMSRGNYSLIELGKRRKSMDIDTLTRLSEVFNVPVTELIQPEMDYENNAL